MGNDSRKSGSGLPGDTSAPEERKGIYESALERSMESGSADSVRRVTAAREAGAEETVNQAAVEPARATVKAQSAGSSGRSERRAGRGGRPAGGSGGGGKGGAGYHEGFGERRIVTLRDLLYILFKHLRSIRTIALVSIVLAMIYSFLATPMYEAETKLLVNIGREKFSQMEEQGSGNYSVLFQERNQNINNELEIFKGDILTSRLVDRFREKLEQMGEKVQEDDGVIDSVINGIRSIFKRKTLDDNQRWILTFKKFLKVQFLAETDILSLKYTWDDPEFAAFAANAYAQEFIRYRSEIYKANKSYKFYREQITLYQDQHDKITEALKSVTKKYSISSIDTEKEMLLRSREDYAAASQGLEREYAMNKALLEDVERMYSEKAAWIETPELGKEITVDRQSYLQDLDRQYFTLKLEADQLAGRYTAKSREMRDIRANISNLRFRKYSSLKNILITKLHSLESQIGSYDEEIKARDERVGELSQIAYTMDKLKLQESIIRENLLNYTQRAENLRIYDDLGDRQITSIKVVSEATPPIQHTSPKRTLIIITAAFLGLFVSFGFSAIREFFSHVFRDERDVHDVLETKLLAAVNEVSR